MLCLYFLFIYFNDLCNTNYLNTCRTIFTEFAGLVELWLQMNEHGVSFSISQWTPPQQPIFVGFIGFHLQCVLVLSFFAETVNGVVSADIRRSMYQSIALSHGSVGQRCAVLDRRPLSCVEHSSFITENVTGSRPTFVLYAYLFVYADRVDLYSTPWGMLQYICLWQDVGIFGNVRSTEAVTIQ